MIIAILARLPEDFRGLGNYVGRCKAFRYLCCLAFILVLLMGDPSLAQASPKPPIDTLRRSLTASAPQANLDWNQPFAGERTIEYFQVADSCGPTELRINALDSDGRELPYWGSVEGQSWRRGSSNSMLFAAGNYRVRVRLLKPELATHCEVDITLTTYANGGKYSDYRLQTFTGYDASLDKLSTLERYRSNIMIALARRGLGDLVSLPSIQVFDFFGNFGEPFNEVGPRALSELASFCGWRSSDYPNQPEYPDEKRVIFDSLIGQLATKNLNASSPSIVDVDQVCRYNVVSATDVAKAMKSPKFKRLVISLLLQKNAPVDLNQMILNISDAMGVDPDVIVLRWNDHPNCSPGYATISGDISTGRSCREGAIVSGSMEIERFLPNRAKARNEAVPLSRITLSRVQRGLDQLAGRRVAFEVTHNSNGTIKLRLSPVRGLVLRNQRLWELVDLTISIGDRGVFGGSISGSEPTQPISITIDGWTAAGIGSRPPTVESFTAGPSMDHKYFSDMQRFIESLLVKISSP